MGERECEIRGWESVRESRGWERESESKGWERGSREEERELEREINSRQ